MLRKFLISSLLLIVASMMSLKEPQDGRYNQTKDTRAVLKALYIYNFSTLTDWPSSYKSGNFVIGIIGKNKVFEELKEKYQDKTVGSQTIKIKQVSISSLSTKKNELVYVTKQNSAKIRQVINNLGQKSTLLVTEQSGALSQGAAINFIVKGNKQSYEISESNAEQKNLVFASKLIDLATN